MAIRPVRKGIAVDRAIIHEPTAETNEITTPELIVPDFMRIICILVYEVFILIMLDNILYLFREGNKRCGRLNLLIQNGL